MKPHLVVFVLISPLALACHGDRDDGAARGGVLRLAVTTSTRDSGLLDVLVPVFERDRGVRLDVIAVGTGKALKLGEAGDVDAVLVHSRASEDAFVAAGHGVRREDVMYNTFEILGPPDDPAAIAGVDPVAALQRIAAGRHRFVSRGDDSGTHRREQALWKSAGGRPEWEGYRESGQGMGATLRIADEMGAYVLVDRGTRLRYAQDVALRPLLGDTAELRNPYGLVLIDAARHPEIQDVAARRPADRLVPDEAARTTAAFRAHAAPRSHPPPPARWGRRCWPPKGRSLRNEGRSEMTLPHRRPMMALLIVAFLALGANAVGAAPKPPASREALAAYREALSEWQAGHQKKAVSDFSKAARLAPRWGAPNARLEIGRASCRERV